MRVYPDCIPCFLRQALEAARRVTEDRKEQREVLSEVAALIPSLPMDATPVDMGRVIHRTVNAVIGSVDPYREVKKEYNDRALLLYPQLKQRVKNSPDSLLTAIKLSAAGNVIDFGVGAKFDLSQSIEEGLREKLVGFDYALLKERLEQVEEILYLGDNAGEIVLDKIVVEELVSRGKKVTFVVRGKPIINDVTLEDASYVEMDEVANVISSGCDAPGTTLRYCDSAFIETFGKSKLIIAKGHGNFEGLSEEDRPLFFLLKVKCPVVAAELGATVGSIVLRAKARRKM